MKSSLFFKKNSMVDEDAIYAAIAKEIETGNIDKALWTRLFAENQGSENKTKAAYIKQRAAKLIALEQTKLVEDKSNLDLSIKPSASPHLARAETLLGLTALIAFTLLSYSYWGFTQDDAYVILRYANNLLSGHGLVFNPGERVEGYTELLWTLLATAGLWLGLPGVQLLKILSMLFGLLAIGFLWAAGRRLIQNPLLNAIPALMWAVSPSFVLWSQGGLGTTLISFLLVVHLYALLRYFERPKQTDLILAAIAMALAVLSRPEAAMYFVLSLAGIWLYSRSRGSKKDVWLFSAIGGGTLLALLIFRLVYFGEIHPNTYYAKVSTDPMQWVHGMRELWHGVIMRDGNWIFFAAILPITLWRRHSYGILWLAAAVLIHSLYYIRIGGDLLPLHRLYQPAFAFLYLFFVIALSSVIDSLHGKNTFMVPGNYKLIVNAISLPICLSLVVILTSSTFGLAAYKNVQERIEACHSHFGRYVENKYRPGDKIAVFDVGATSYYAKSYYVIDLLGLTDRTVAKAFYDNGFDYWLGYLSWQRPEYQHGKAAFEAQVLSYFKQQSPRFIVTQFNIPQEQIATMRNYVKAPPPRLNDFLLTYLQYEGNHGIFRDKQVLNSYNIVEIVEWNAFAYYVLLERKS